MIYKEIKIREINEGFTINNSANTFIVKNTIQEIIDYIEDSCTEREQNDLIYLNK